MLYPSYFLILFISVFVVALVIGILVLLNNRRAAANISFFALTLAVAIWALGLGFATTASDASMAEIWRRISALGWCPAFAIILHLVLVITEQDLLKHWWSTLFLYLPAALCIVAFAIPNSLNPTPYFLHLTEFGWVNIAANNIWDWFFYIYYIGYTILALTLILQWGKRSKKRNVKMQSQAIFWSFMVTFILGTITDILIKDIPQMAPIVLLLPIIVIYRLITKYGFIIAEPTDKKNHFLFIVVCVILYVLLSFSQAQLTILHSFNLGPLDQYTTMGIITHLQMLLSIYVVIREDQAGLITAILLNGFSLLSLLIILFSQSSVALVPGIISHLVAFLIIALIAMYKQTTGLQIEKINQQRDSLKKSEQKLYHMAYYDSLTGLPNRDQFVEKLDKAIQEAKENDSLLGVVFLDLDSFKPINDSMGYSTGDLLLKMMARKLASCLRDEDTIGRFGADEFLILITNIRKLKYLKKITDRIMASFQEYITIQDVEYFMTASAGVAVYPMDGEDSETLIKNADIAMYRAKTEGKNQCIYCSETIKEETMMQIKLTNSLYRALDRNELHLHYQPQINVETQEIIGFEALLRWNSKELGQISPNVFIPIAEQTGLIRPIGLWVIKTALEQFKAIKNSFNNNCIISINISIEQLKDNNIAEKISNILSEIEMDPRDMQIEITESIAFNEDPRILQRLKDIRQLGIAVSIDDFGKGYSSFNRLKTFPIDLLKIDIDFVRGITSESTMDRAIIKSIIQIAKNLDIKVLAEGVETKEQYQYLKEHGCDIIQGYYFYKPMPPNEIEKLDNNPPQHPSNI